MTLISIVGDDISRIVPLLFAYREKIRHHVLLCDDDPSNYQRAKKLQHGMQRFSDKYKLGWHTKIISANEDSASSIKEAAQRAFAHSTQLWLNATDGYPGITILLSDLVRQEGGKILSYDHFDNDLHTIEPDGTMHTQKLASKIDMESYLTLLDYRIVHQVEKSEIEGRKKAVLSLFKEESRFVKLRQALVAKALQKPYDFDFSTATEMLETLKQIGIVDNNFDLIPSKQSMLQGGLYEEYIFWLCESLNPDDIRMAVTIDFDDKSAEPLSNHRVQNEFDIVLMYNNRLHTVECKYSKSLNGLEIVYKYDAIIDYFGKASKAIIANISSKPKKKYMQTKTSSNFRPSTLRRGRMAGISVYHETQMNPIKFQNLVRNFFHLG